MSKAPSKRLADSTLGEDTDNSFSSTHFLVESLDAVGRPQSLSIPFRKIQDSHRVVEALLQNVHDPLKHLPRCFHVQRLPDHPELGVKLRLQLFWAGVQDVACKVGLAPLPHYFLELSLKPP